MTSDFTTVLPILGADGFFPFTFIRPTGDAVTADCVEKIIRKDMVHPLTGQKLEEGDIIPLQRGGTGYAAVNEQLKAKHYRPNLAIN